MQSERQGVLADRQAIFPESKFTRMSSEYEESIHEKIADNLEALLYIQQNLQDGSNMTDENRQELERTINKLIREIKFYEDELNISGGE